MSEGYPRLRRSRHEYVAPIVTGLPGEYEVLQRIGTIADAMTEGLSLDSATELAASINEFLINHAIPVYLDVHATEGRTRVDVIQGPPVPFTELQVEGIRNLQRYLVRR